MKFFRSHITRFTTTYILFAGLVFYFINPTDDEVKHEAFASWLQSNLKTQDDSVILDQIKELSSLNEELESVIKKASLLVQNNSGIFKLPVDKSASDEKEIFRLLLSEWQAFQNSPDGMGKAVIITNAKPYSVLPIGSLSFAGKTISPHLNNNILSDDGVISEPLASVDYHISPLTGGVAIGAP